MKKPVFILAVVIYFIVSFFIVMQVNVPTQRCINYHCFVTRLPLFLKILDFFDRHYNYKELVNTIQAERDTEETRVKKILFWTVNNIKRMPAGMPVVDDHAWYTIIRGYGVEDQFSDIFTTLCNYAQMDSFFCTLPDKKENNWKSLAFVRLNNRWSVFDAFEGVYFINNKGAIADINNLLENNWRAISITGGKPADYQEYFANLGSVDFKNWKFTRASLQSPFKRFIFWLKGIQRKRSF